MLESMLVQLTPSQRTVLTARLAGRSLADAAREAGLASKQLAAFHERRALAKLGVKGTVESVVWAACRAARAVQYRAASRLTAHLGLRQVA